MIDIIDVGCGNIQSLTNILTLLQVPSRAVNSPNQVKSNTIILPGVGSAGPYMDKLKESSLDQAIKKHHSEGKRIIGICLGFQLLTISSEEDGGTECLGLVDAQTEKIGSNQLRNCSHTGWEHFQIDTEYFNAAECQAQLGLTRKRKLKGRVFYNHEYGVCSTSEDAAHLEIPNKMYAGYSSMVVQKNLIGIQFHPEKSQVTGLNLFEMML